MEKLLALIGFGIATGGVIMLPALGMSLQTSIDRFLNVAHGEFFTLSAFLYWWLWETGGLPLPLSALFAVLITMLVGPLLQRVIFEPLRGRAALVLLTTSLGLSMVLQNSILAVWGARARRIEVGREWSIPYDWSGPFRITPATVLILGVALVAAGLVTWLLNHSPWGKGMRAMAANSDLARVSGVPVRWMSSLTWAVAAGLAGVGGVLFMFTSTVSPDTGFLFLLTIAAAMLAGGLGSPKGAILGAIVVGVGMEVSTNWMSPSLRPGIALVALGVVLLFRPQGLYGKVMLK